jgi:TPP-dependent 2-oxoacid decarboxylase
MEEGMSIGDYLIKQIYDNGARHVFGLPGDYVLGLMKKITQSDLKLINTCDEQGAGFAADAYARMRGFGVVCITYSVGGLKIANTTGQAFAEKSPVLVISGAPGRVERSKNTLLHHKVNEFDDQIKIFERLTVASADLSDVERAFSEIDRVISTVLQYKRPGYIEVPRDVVSVVPQSCVSHKPAPAQKGAPGPISEALKETIDMLNSSRKPAILAGVEVHRFGLGEKVMDLSRRANAPIASTILGKSSIPEEDPLYMGIYMGARGDDAVKEYIESSDCLILIGVFMTDLNMGSFTAHLDPGRFVNMTSERTSVKYHLYPGLGLNLLAALLGSEIKRHDLGEFPHPKRPEPFCDASCDKKITANRFFQAINSFMDEKTVLIADVGDSLFGSTDVTIPTQGHFLSSAYYASMGFSVPAGLGVQAADPDLRPLILVGDGAFQMTGMEVASAVRYGYRPIVIVMENGGYETERLIIDGEFNDIAQWKYSRIPDVLGAGKGFRIETEEDLDRALKDARNYDGVSILDVVLSPHDVSSALKKTSEGLSKSAR